jgi:hypothetical protein
MVMQIQHCLTFLSWMTVSSLTEMMLTKLRNCRTCCMGSQAALEQNQEQFNKKQIL